MAGRQGRRRFGAIRRLPSGRYQVRYRTAGGRYVTAPTTFETKADAGRYLSKIETDMLRGDWADPRLGRTTFGEWADRWLDSTVNLRANTKAGYRSILRLYLRPAFGHYPLARIDVLAVRTWLAKLEADGVGQATRAKAYRLLARILGAAVEARYLAVNSCHPPGGQRGSPGDADRHRRPGGRHRQPGAVALPRAGPGGRLRWPALGGAGRATAQARRPGARHGHGGRAAPGGQRQPLGWAAQERRRAPHHRPAGRRGQGLAEHLARYTAKSPEAFVFLSSQGMHLRRSNFNRRVWQPATRAAGVEGLRVHDLRHTAGTLATAAGGSLREVMDRLGHSTTVAAVRYQHVMVDRDAAIARELNRLIEGG
jgi:integrase